ncbi:hypothetical protein HXX76_010537 [Chlamydomonas incerta]|uniref:ZIP family transporter n=1 Tax=Chlamydomonas incerta TaxID=51695 RepID=A0A835SU27_CHLIN|nr:hypothetical protein HXX76_010537 [Chlamydomonas incerta]|eukprot:KAG2429753.1 hypothetical protein HXX76_010537 [Chlamydomonas incerta]
MSGLGGLSYPLGGLCVLGGVALMLLLEHLSQILHNSQAAVAAAAATGGCGHSHGSSNRGHASGSAHDRRRAGNASARRSSAASSTADGCSSHSVPLLAGMEGGDEEGHHPHAHHHDHLHLHHEHEHEHDHAHDVEAPLTPEVLRAGDAAAGGQRAPDLRAPAGERESSAAVSPTHHNHHHQHVHEEQPHTRQDVVVVVSGSGQQEGQLPSEPEAGARLKSVHSHQVPMPVDLDLDADTVPYSNSDSGAAAAAGTATANGHGHSHSHAHEAHAADKAALLQQHRAPSRSSKQHKQHHPHPHQGDTQQHHASYEQPPPQHQHTCVTYGNAPSLLTIAVGSGGEAAAGGDAAAGGLGGGSLRLRLLAYMFELGCVFHSLVIGLAVGVITEDVAQVRALLIALSFHQWLEGLGLGSVIARGGFSRAKAAAMAGFYSLTCPAGVATGMALARLYDPDSEVARGVQGTLNGVSGGMLLYISLVQLVAEDMGRFVPGGGAGGGGGAGTGRRLMSFAALCGGAGAMCLLAIWT